MVGIEILLCLGDGVLYVCLVRSECSLKVSGEVAGSVNLYLCLCQLRLDTVNSLHERNVCLIFGILCLYPLFQGLYLLAYRLLVVL